MIFFTGSACYSPYIVVFLSGRGVSSTTIGLLLMISSMIAVMSQPLWGMLSDRIHSIRKVFSFCLLTAIMLILSLTVIKSITAVEIMLPIIALMQSPLGILLDIWILKSAQNGVSASYGSIRMWGSIGFAISVAVMGALVNKMSINVAFIFYGAINSFTLFICYKMKDFNRREEDNGNAASPDKSHTPGKGHTPGESPMPGKGHTPGRSHTPAGSLLRNARYITIVLFLCAIYITLNPMSSFMPKLMLNAGGTTGLYGLAMGVQAFTEVPILFISGALIKKFKPLHMILVATFFYVVRMAIYSTIATPAGILFAQCLQGLSFAFMAPGTIHYIDSLVPESAKSTALTTAVAVYGGLGGMIGNSVGGSLIDKVGIISAYRTGAIFLAIVFVLFTCYVVSGNIIDSRRISGKQVFKS